MQRKRNKKKMLYGGLVATLLILMGVYHFSSLRKRRPSYDHIPQNFTPVRRVMADQPKRGPQDVVLLSPLRAPYVCPVGSEDEGYVVDVVRTIFESKGYRVFAHPTNQQRTREWLASGRANAWLGAESRDDLTFAGVVLVRQRTVFYVRSDSSWVFDKEPITKARLALVDRQEYPEWISDYIEMNRSNDERIVWVPRTESVEGCLRLLLAGRATAVLGDEAATRYAAKRLNVLDKIKPAGYGKHVVLHRLGFLARNEDSGKLAKILTEGIKQLRASGKLSAILDRYGLEDWAVKEGG